MYDLLFQPLRLGAIALANRLVSLPLYLAYPDEDHEVSVPQVDEKFQQ